MNTTVTMESEDSCEAEATEPTIRWADRAAGESKRRATRVALAVRLMQLTDLGRFKHTNAGRMEGQERESQLLLWRRKRKEKKRKMRPPHNQQGRSGMEGKGTQGQNRKDEQ